MSRPFLLFASIVICVSRGDAQVSLTAHDITVQVSPTQAWTDSGLDLQSGNVLQISAAPAESSSAGAPACDPAGVAASFSQTATLPLPSAAPGALIARLHAQGAAPVLIGVSTELKIEEASHLFLGMNISGTAICQGTLSVKIHIAPAGSTTSDVEQKPRSQQLKSQLATAAQVFMSGQFGMGKSETGSSSATSATGATAGTSTAAVTPLKLSDAPLDSHLRQSIDGLPRRVNDQFQNLGDMVNFVIVGNEKDVQDALAAATWHVADTNNTRAVINALSQTYDSKDYLAMPMSTLFLFGRRQDFGYEMAEPIAMVASRHHFRIWKSLVTWQGKEVWCGAGTHDIGFAKDKRNGSVTHKIDPSVDGERDNIGGSLQKASKVKSMTYYLPKDAVQDAKNATGDGYHSDGKVLVIVLQ
jgi:hypothetical protein